MSKTCAKHQGAAVHFRGELCPLCEALVALAKQDEAEEAAEDRTRMPISSFVVLSLSAHEAGMAAMALIHHFGAELSLPADLPITARRLLQAWESACRRHTTALMGLTSGLVVPG